MLVAVAVESSSGAGGEEGEAAGSRASFGLHASLWTSQPGCTAPQPLGLPASHVVLVVCVLVGGGVAAFWAKKCQKKRVLSP